VQEPKLTSLSVENGVNIFRRNKARTPEVEAQNPRLLDQLSDESQSKEVVEAFGPYLQHLLDNGKISQEKYYAFRESVNRSLTECSISEGLTFDSPNALELTKIANEALFLSGQNYICRVGVLEKGQGFKAYVLADGTIVFSQEMINQFIEAGEPDAIVGVLVHELGHILNETAATLVNAEDFVSQSAFGWAHEMGGDGLAPLILSRLGTKTDLLEKSFAILRKQQNGKSRGAVHESHLARESAQVAIRSKVHLKGGNRHFQFEGFDTIPTNGELLRQHLKELNEVTYEDLQKLSDHDLNAFFNYSFYPDNGQFLQSSIETRTHIEKTKRHYIMSLAQENGFSLNPAELTIIETAFDYVISLDNLIHSPEDILAYVNQINDPFFVHKFNTLLVSSRISYLADTTDGTKISKIFESIFSHIYDIYSHDQENRVRLFSFEEINLLFTIFDSSPFLSQYCRELGYYCVTTMLMITLSKKKDLSESNTEPYLQILKTAEKKTNSGRKWSYSDKEMVEEQLHNAYSHHWGGENENFRKFLRNTFFEIYNRDIDYKEPEVFLSWDELKSEFYNTFSNLKIVNDPQVVLETLEELSKQFRKTINKLGYEYPVSMEEIITIYEEFFEPISEILRNLFSQIDLAQNQELFYKLLTQYKSMFQMDAWFSIDKTEDQTERNQKEEYVRSKKADFVLDYQNIILQFSDSLTLKTIHSSLDGFRAILSNKNDLERYRVSPEKILDHPIWKILRVRYEQEFPLNKIEDFLEFKNFLAQRSTGHLKFNNIYRDDFYGVIIFAHARERLKILISQSNDQDIPVIIDVLESIADTSLIDTGGLIARLRWTYLRSDSSQISFDKKCQFWIDNAVYLHESGLNELASQVKTPAEARLLQTISQKKLENVLAGKSEKSEMTAVYMADLAFELFGDNGVIDLIESCLPDNQKSSTRLAQRWFQIHQDSFKAQTGKVEAKIVDSFSSDLIRFDYYRNLTIKQLISVFQNLPVETKIGIFARLLSGDSSPLHTEDGKNRLADIVCRFVGEKGTTTELLLRGVIDAEDQAYLVHIVSQGLGPSLFDGFSIDAVDKSRVARSIRHNSYEILSARNVVNQVIQFEEVDVEKGYDKPYLVNAEFARTSHGLRHEANDLEKSISSRFFQSKTNREQKNSKKFQPSDRVRVLEKTGAHLVKGMQIGFQLLPDLTVEQREELADSQDSMQAIEDYWFQVNLHELAKIDPRVQKFVDSIVEYGGAHPDGAYVGGGSLFSVYRVKARLSDGSERWVVVKMIRPEASDFNQRSIHFVDNILDNAQNNANKKQRKQLDLLGFISQLAGQWTEEEILNEGNLELEARFRDFITYSGLDDVTIPELILTTDELRIEFEVEGNTLNREIRTETNVSRRVALLEKFLEFIDLQLNSLDICHPDPHLGNLLVEPTNNDRLNIIDINRLIDLSDQEKDIFRALIQGNSRIFLNLFVNLFNEENRDKGEFSLSNDEIARLLKTIRQRIIKNRISNAFRGGSNPFMEWQLLIETLVEAGMKAEDFKVDWQLMFRMIALRNSTRQQIRELRQAA
jgi:predicted unusual protein kinase regulating ubiquinone biosynthesis (AarF/ABC1/UbiB family)